MGAFGVSRPSLGLLAPRSAQASRHRPAWRLIRWVAAGWGSWVQDLPLRQRPATGPRGGHEGATNDEILNHGTKNLRANQFKA